MISKAEILMGRDKAHPLDQECQENLQKLLTAVNLLRKHYGKPMFVSSGYRPAAINAKVKGAAKKSNHMICAAVDFRDVDRKLSEFCMKNLHILEACGLWLEDPAATPTWLHVQIYPPRSGRRVFKP
jgi:uncharacterized protein YcbK (DUF882 family)